MRILFEDWFFDRLSILTMPSKTAFLKRETDLL